MARAVSAWLDARGQYHAAERDALLVDVEAALGANGSGSEMAITPGIAKLIAEKGATLLPLIKRLVKLDVPVTPSPDGAA